MIQIVKQLMMKLKFSLFAGVFLLTTSFFPGCQGQPAGYHIETNIKGCLPGDLIILARYVGTETIPVDTLSCTSGTTVFTGIKPLTPGMFTLLFGKGGKIDLLISDTLNQQFSLSADAGQLLSSLTFEGSPENSAFTEYRKTPGRQSSLSSLFQKQFPGKLLSLFLQTLKEPKAPEPSIPLMVTDRNRYIQEYYFRYAKEHFWDETPFSDPRLVGIPVYEEKLHFYFQQMVEPSPEAAAMAVEKLLDRAGANDEVFRFTVKSLYRMYRESPFQAVIPVSLFLAENFVLNRKEDWGNDPFYGQVIEKVAKARLNPVGSPATDLKLVRHTGEPLRLSGVKARVTILYFFNPDCESCHPITDKLLPLYHQYKNRGVEVFAVYLDKKSAVWKEYISSKRLDWINVYDPSGEEGIESKYDIYAIPMIYVLDKDKKVLARDVPVEELENYL